jgi:gliding motility-associated-like protein
MKRFLLLLIVFFSFNTLTFGQATCGAAAAFCAGGTGFTYPNTTNNPSPGGGINYGCLGSQPNPAWYYIQIGTSGPIVITISQVSSGGNPIDVDFIAWGPFTSPSCGTANLNPTTQIDCNYSTAATETATFPNAIAGQYYMILITNFANQAGNITLTQTNASLPTAGSTNCNAVLDLQGGAALCPGQCRNLTTFINGEDPTTNPTIYNGCTFTWTSTAPGFVPPATNTGVLSVCAPGSYTVTVNKPGFFTNVQSTEVITAIVTPNFNVSTPALTTCVGQTFNFNTQIPLILNGVVPTGIVRYYTNQAAALSQFPASDRILNITNYTPPALPTATNPNPLQVWASITSTCTFAVPFTLNFIPCNPIATNNGPICTGGTFDLSCTIAPAGYSIYTWTGPNGYSAVGQNQTGVPAPTGVGPYVYSCTVTSATLPALAAATTTVVVNPAPVITITNPASVCFPLSVDLTAAAVTAGSTNLGTMTYWTDAAATIALATPTAVASSGTYYIRSGTGSCFDIKPVTVTINPKPVILISNPVGVCSPTTVNLTAATVTAGSTNVGATFTYWTNATATTPLTTANAVTTSGTYYIQTTTAAGCSDIKPVTVTITVTPSITIVNPSPVCFPLTVDLTAAAVTAGSTNLGTMTYWTDAAATIALATPTAVASSGTYYIRSGTGSCFDIKPVTVTINPKPVILISNPVGVCSPTTVNLTAAAVTAGSTNVGATFTYWTNATATTPLTTANAVTTSGTYYIQTTTAAGCSDIKPVTVTITLTPIIAIVTPASVCFPSTVDLTAAAVTAGSTNLGTMTYWTDAAATIALATPTAVASSGTYYIRSGTGSCFDIKPVTVTINPKPVILISNPVGVCSPTTVNLTAAAVTAGSTNVGATFTYWTNATATTPLTTANAVTTSGTYYIQTTTAAGCSDIKPVTVTVTLTPIIAIVTPASVCFPSTVDITLPAVTAGSTNLGTMTYWTDAAATIALATPTAVASSGTYYIRSGTGSCFDIKPVTVTINPKPVILISNPVGVCSPTTVNLTAAAVTAGSTNVGATFTYWTNATATTPLTTANAVTTSGTYYIQTTTAAGCSDIKPVTVTVTQSPVLVIVNPDSVCFPSTVNITASSVTLGSTGGGVLTYWTDALATIPLGTPSSVSASGTYYIKSTSGTCSDIKSVTVVVNSVLSLIITNPTQVCFPGTIDITLPAITAGSTVGGTLSYWSDAAATIPLLNTTTIATSGTYYIKTILGPCQNIKAVVVTINALPNPLITGINNICVDFNTNTLISGTTLNSGILPANHTFEWFLNGSTTALVGEVNAILNINTITPGNYTVRATNTATTCVSTISLPFTVIQSGPPTNESYTLTNAFTENQILTIGVNGFGTYEYSIDGGAYQTSNVFDHVTIGIHSVEIRDVKGDKSCVPNATIINIETIDYPHYFTPNGDGFNDTWNIARLINQPNAKIYIFDRYGKLLKQIAPAGAGWDGNFNGELQLATDYWFTVEYLEQNVTKVFKANFSLKR